MTIIFSQFLLTIFFLTIVFLHIGKKNLGAVRTYGFQSFIIFIIMIGAFFESKSTSMLFLALLVLVVKVILAPVFIAWMIKNQKLKFLASNYVNLPLTFIIIAILTALAHSSLFAPLVNIVPANRELLSLCLSALLISFFLLVNRKGALSQIIGVLSLENSIVAFAFFVGLEQSPAIELGIMFDIAVWVIIATIFISMIYRHFGSLDVTEMKNLKD
jgi:hydrogenase-4 component E